MGEMRIVVRFACTLVLCACGEPTPPRAYVGPATQVLSSALRGGTEVARWTEAPVSVLRRSGHAMAYDAARRRVVLFGGDANGALDGGLLADTWTFDGKSWRRLAPPVSPSARSGHAMAYDAARRRVVLFGGRRADGWAGDTWTWDGVIWTRSARPSPYRRAHHAMAYDAAREQVVLIGGDSDEGILDDTWIWDGRDWTRQAPVNKPSARANHAMTYDAAREDVVLFGGRSASGDRAGYLKDTWIWDGKDWTPGAGSTALIGRIDHAMAYDARRERVVLLGGHSDGASGAAVITDPWTWDGTRWTHGAADESPDVFPAVRNAPALVSDAAHERLILFGGLVGSRPVADTWIWDGATWSRASPASPPPLIGYAMAYDAARERVVLLGPGSTSDAVRGVTWTWDGFAWKEEAPATAPPTRTEHAIAYDAARERTVLFGGASPSMVRPVPPDPWPSPNLFWFADTWTWNGTTWMPRRPHTSPPPTSGHAMAYDAARERVVLLRNPKSDTPPLELELDDAGAAELPAMQTWTWDGTTWTHEEPPVSPPSRDGGFRLVYDEADERVVLYGGLHGDTGTWTWDGATWEPGQGAVARGESALAFHPGLGRVVLFGGSSVHGQVLDDTWTWDGSVWVEEFPCASPSPRSGHSMVYDAARAQIVLYGGLTARQNTGSAVALGDTWAFDLAREPSPRDAGACLDGACGGGACDPARSSPDAARSPDAADGGRELEANAGCDCDVAHRSRSPALPWGLALVAALRLRRRRADPPTAS